MALYRKAAATAWRLAAGVTAFALVAGLGQGPAPLFAQGADPAVAQLAAALDANGNGVLDDAEIASAIRLWILGQVVPGTGQTISDDVIGALVRLWITGAPLGPPGPPGGQVLLDTADCDFSGFSDRDGQAVRVGRFSTAFAGPPFENSLAHQAFLDDGRDPCGLIFSTGAIGSLDLGVWVHSQIVIDLPVGGGVLRKWSQRQATWQEPQNVPANRRVWANNIVRVLRDPNLTDDQKQVLLKRIEAKGDDYKALVDGTGFMPGQMEHTELRLGPGIRRIVIEFRFHLSLFTAAVEMISDLRLEWVGAPTNPNDVLDVPAEPGTDEAHIRFEFVDDVTDPFVPLVDTTGCDFSDFDNQDGQAVRVGRFSSLFRNAPFADSFALDAFNDWGLDPCGLIFSTGSIGGQDLGFWVHSRIQIIDVEPGGFTRIWWLRGAAWQEPKPPQGPKLLDPKQVPSSVRRWAANINRVQQNPNLTREQRRELLGQIAQKGRKYERLVQQVDGEEKTDNSGFMPPEHEQVVIFTPPSVRVITIEFTFHLTAFSAAAEIIQDFRADSFQNLPPGVSPNEVINVAPGVDGAAHVEFEFVDEPDEAFNQPPQATFAYELTADGVLFFAEAFDPDGFIQQYHWDFGDGNTANGPNVLHSFGAMGNYEVTLMVMDNGGLTASNTMTVNYGM